MNIGIIGSEGVIGKRRADIISKEYPRAKLSLFDTCNTQWYNNYKEFLNGVDLDAVFVCVPHTVTPEIVEYALNKGLHVFAEKPPGVCLDDVVRMQKALNGNKDLKLKFGFNHRHYHHIAKAKSVIDNGKLGEVQWMRGLYGKVDFENWRANQELAGHGILVSQGIHLIDLFRYLTGDEFTKVKSICSNFQGKWYEDNVFALMESEGGRSAFLHSSCLMGKNTFNIMIGMEKGYIHINGLFTRSKSFGFPEICSIATNSNTTFYGNPTEEVYKYGKDISWLTEIKEFFDCIRNDKPVQNGTIYDAYEVMSVVEKIYHDGGII